MSWYRFAELVMLTIGIGSFLVCGFCVIAILMSLIRDDPCAGEGGTSEVPPRPDFPDVIPEWMLSEPRWGS